MTNAITKRIENTAIAALRILSAEQVETANSGHPGMPLGAADAAYVLWTRFLRHNPTDPNWIARDRFILSAGHASALLYSLLHLSGYSLPLEQLARFRQKGSITPGHPERGETPGVEMTTGPLGQGLGSSVGIALGLKMLEERFASSSFPGLGSRVWTLASDGDMMEGLSSEVGSFAGHIGMNNLVVIYDSNGVTIDGKTSITFSEDVGARFSAFGWKVLEVNGHDIEALTETLGEASGPSDSPVLVISRTLMGRGVPGREGDYKLHGSPLGSKMFSTMKEALGRNEVEPFTVPEEAYHPFRYRVETIRNEYDAWQKQFRQWRDTNHEAAQLWDSMFEGSLSRDVEETLLEAMGDEQKATRVFSGKALQTAAPLAPWLIGGSADLASSNNVALNAPPSIGPGTYKGKEIHFGIREHCMAAVNNGLALTEAFRPFAATFLVFSDYMRPSIRMAALMNLPVFYIFTHDSIFVGEDGPTHQPIEHLASLRAIPGLIVFRPADGPEVAACWAMSLRKKQGPVVFVLSRQKVEKLPRDPGNGFPPVERGGYILLDPPDPRLVLVATGSEVGTTVQTASLLAENSWPARVVSMPCVELFLRQSKTYRQSVLPRNLPVVAVEAASQFGWERVIGRDGLFVGLHGFGASAPADVLREEFGLSPDSISHKILNWLS